MQTLHVDFHTHTTVSDGVWTTAQLFDFVRDAGIEWFSLTDHDTMAGYPLPADIAARAVSGMEVDSKCNGVTAHLLVYGLRTPEAPLLQRLRRQREERFARMQEMLERLEEHGISIAMTEVEQQAKGASSLGRPHLARALVERGIVTSVQEAFDRYLADDGTAYVSLDRLTSAEVVALAHESGALVSAAHPRRLREPASLDALRADGIDAVEIVHPSADDEARGELSAYAHEHGLLRTGGSDFHMPDNGYQPGITMDRGDVERFLQRVSGSARAFGEAFAHQATKR